MFDCLWYFFINSRLPEPFFFLFATGLPEGVPLDFFHRNDRKGCKRDHHPCELEIDTPKV